MGKLIWWNEYTRIILKVKQSIKYKRRGKGEVISFFVIRKGDIMEFYPVSIEKLIEEF